MKVIAHTIETQYQVIGQGPILVLLHGWGCDWQVWAPVIPTLADSYRLVIPDLPAFGASQNPPLSWSSFEYKEWLRDFLRQVIPHQKYSLLGHSFGGKIASLFAADFHQTAELLLLEKLVLVDSAGTPNELSSLKKLQQSLLSLVPSKIKESTPYSLKTKLLGATGSASDHLNSTQAQRQILKNIIREYIVKELHKITIPTLLMWGENDQDTPLPHAFLFHQSIEQSHLHIIKNAGHFCFVDQTQEFLEHLTTFLKEKHA